MRGLVILLALGVAVAAAGCVSVVPPRLAVPLPDDHVAVGGFGVAGVGQQFESDSIGVFGTAGGGAVVAAPVWLHDGFRLELDGALGAGVLDGPERIYAGGALGARVWRAVDVDEAVSVGLDARLSGLARLSTAGLTPTTGHGELRALGAWRALNAVVLGARPGVVVAGADHGRSPVVVDVPVSLVLQRPQFHVGAEVGVGVPVLTFPFLFLSAHAGGEVVFYF